MECKICCCKFTDNKRKGIICIYCQENICLECVKKYLLQTLSDPHCMMCKKYWSMEFIEQFLSKSFLNTDYKKHREEILLDRERALFHDTMPYAALQKKIDILTLENKQLRKEKIIMSNNYKLYKDVIFNRYFANHSEDENIALIQKCADSEQGCFIKKNQIKWNSEKIRILDKDVTKSSQKKEFIKECPVTNCRGFLSQQWKCGLCNTFSCSKCHEVIGLSKDDPHTCNPDNIHSVDFIKSNSKQCPNCGTYIYKIFGCDQMFCTKCNTPFSWFTRDIINGAIHNPYYFEYLQRNNLDELPTNTCNLMQHANPNFKTFLTNINIFTQTNLDLLNKMLQLIYHIEDVEIYHINDDNRHIRIKYLLNYISMDKFKSLIYKEEKENRKKRDYNNIWNMFIDTCNSIYSSITKQEDLEQFDKLRLYVNECLANLSYTYNSTYVYSISNLWFIDCKKIEKK